MSEDRMADVQDLLLQFDSLHARVKTLQDHVGSPAKSQPKVDARSQTSPKMPPAEPIRRTSTPSAQKQTPEMNGEARPSIEHSSLQENVLRLERENAALQRQLQERNTVEALVQLFEQRMEEDKADRQAMLDHVIDRFDQPAVQPPMPIGERISMQDIQAVTSRLEKRIEELGESLERSSTAARVAMEREAVHRRLSKGGAAITSAKASARKKSEDDDPAQQPVLQAKGQEWGELFNASQLEISIKPGAETPGEEQEDTNATNTCGCFGATQKEEVKGWFRIQCKHNSSTWTVVRAASEFVFLHLHLKEKAMRRKLSMEVHHFPKRQFLAATSDRQKKALCASLERYLTQLAAMPEVAAHHIFLQFLQVSAATLQKGYETCLLEGSVSKSTGSAVNQGGCFGCSLSFSWGAKTKANHRWFVLKDSCLFYMHSPLLFQPKGVMLFDRDCTLSPDPSEFQGERRLWRRRLHKIEFKNGGRTLTLHFKRTNQARRWLVALDRAMRCSPYCSMHHKYGSFAPARPHCKLQWFLNGCTYFDAVAHAIDEARREVYIAGWFLSPHVYLRRPSRENEHWRLDKLLQRKAAQGVKVYILLFRELEICLESNNSHFAKQVLRGLHSNIFVLRSPYDIAITYYSHHEKLVVTDAGAGCAFVGGIDLAFGRWDTSAFLLSDASETLLWPGKDYCNEGYCVTKGTDLPFLDHLERTSEPRMPWHDFALKVSGDAAYDVARHFMARWNKRTHNEKDGLYAQLIPEVPMTAEDYYEQGAGQMKPLRRNTEGGRGSQRMSLRGKFAAGRERESRADSVIAAAFTSGRRTMSGPVFSSSDSRRHLILTKQESKRHLKIPPHSDDAASEDEGSTGWRGHGSHHGSGRMVSSMGRQFGDGGWSTAGSGHVLVSGAAFGSEPRAGEAEAEASAATARSVLARARSVSPRGRENAAAAADGPAEQPGSGGPAASGRRGSLQDRRPRFRSVEFSNSDFPHSGVGMEAAAGSPRPVRRAGRSPQAQVRTESPRRKPGSPITRTGSPPAAGGVRPFADGVVELASSELQAHKGDAHLALISEEHSFCARSASTVDSNSSEATRSRTSINLKNRESIRSNSEFSSIPFRTASGAGQSEGRDMLSGRDTLRKLSHLHNMEGSQRSLSQWFSQPMSNSFRRRPSTMSGFMAGDDHSHLRQTLLRDVSQEEDCTCQVLRSIDKWSGDLGNEKSIEEAYVRLIRGAKHYVHIENQFFVSGCEGSDEVENRVTWAIKERIIEEINNERRNKTSSQFRVVVLLPLLPGLPGSPQVNASKRMLLHLQYQTICRNNGNSLLEKLREVTDTPEKYIGFYGLRQWGRMPDGVIRQEQIYIHGKLMIVDDRHILCGSANINDRSLLGKHDSEVALVMTDSEHRVQSKMFGKSWEAFRAARDMRIRLCELHLGAQEGLDMADPCSPDMLQRWQQVARTNTAVFREVFKCFPDDQVLSWETYEEWEEEQDRILVEQEEDGSAAAEVESKLQRIDGHLVEFPLRFLENEDLFPSWTEKEYHVDRRIFT